MTVIRGLYDTIGELYVFSGQIKQNVLAIISEARFMVGLRNYKDNLWNLDRAGFSDQNWFPSTADRVCLAPRGTLVSEYFPLKTFPTTAANLLGESTCNP